MAARDAHTRISEVAPTPTLRGFGFAIANLVVVAGIIPYWHSPRLDRLAALGLPLTVALATWLLQRLGSRRRLQLGGRLALVAALAVVGALATLPTWSWLVLGLSLVVALVLALDPGTNESNGGATIAAGDPPPPRWIRRARLVRGLAVSTFGVGVALLVATSNAELRFADRADGHWLAPLLVAFAGLLGLYAARQFFIAPVLDHLVDDQVLRQRVMRQQVTSNRTHIVRALAWIAVAAAAAMLGWRS